MVFGGEWKPIRQLMIFARLGNKSAKIEESLD